MENLPSKLIAVAKNFRKLIKYPPGHYYSSVPNIDDVSAQKEIIYDKGRKLEGIDLRKNEQMELLENFKAIYPTLFFEKEQNSAGRYYYNNGFYCESDAIMLYCMMHHFQPKRIIEVGSWLLLGCHVGHERKNG